MQMATVFYIEHNGTSHKVDVPPGVSVMKGAVRNNIPGIDGNCGGACVCGTCHVYVDDAWRHKAPSLSVTEEALLTFVKHTRPSSRLSCQIAINDRLDGLVVHMPRTQ
jgi:2Fe-2S ferredoxin